MDNKKKAIISLIVVILTLLVLVIGASYAYFSVTSTNSFGSKTISASAPNVGSVQLIGDNSTLSLNLSAGDMMKKSTNILYWGTTNGTPSTNGTVIPIAHTNVTGEGYFNCSYTLNVTATGTNNLYTAFQGWSGKSTNQILLNINRIDYDFNVSNLFPITINGSMYGVSSSRSKKLTAGIRMQNYMSIDQSALKNKDITITINATNFSCSIAEEPQAYYYVYDTTKTSNNRISDPLTSPTGLNYYLKGYGVPGVYDEVCGVFNGTEYCMEPNTWSNVSTYKSEMEALGATCQYSMYQSNPFATTNYLRCWIGSMDCSIEDTGYVSCGDGNHPEYCGISNIITLCQDPS